MKKKISFLVMLVFLALIIPSMAWASENDTLVGDGDESVDLNVYASMDSVSVHEGTDAEIYVGAVNLGPGTAHDVNVFCNIPSGLTYKDHEISKGSFDEERGIWSIGELKAYEKEDLKLILHSERMGDATVSFQIDSNSKDVDIENNKASVDVHTTGKVGPTSRDDDTRHVDLSYFSMDDYSNFREVTRSTNKSAEAKMDEKPTANPIMLAALSITLLISVRFKKNRF